jgi:small subunit ribosomal protein S17
MERQRARAKTREGVVVSSAMDKTVVVAVKRTVRHRRYHKYLTVSTKYLAHDEQNQCNVGDRVVIAETRPLSKRKRWRLRQIVEHAVRDLPEAGEIG